MTTIAHLMILVAALLPYAAIGPAKWSSRAYDNHLPRQWADSQSGWRQRMDWAHRNHFEAFAPFAAAVLLAEYQDTPPWLVATLSVAFVCCRVAYTLAYLRDLATLRSVLWSLGFLCVLALFALGL